MCYNFPLLFRLQAEACATPRGCGLCSGMSQASRSGLALLVSGLVAELSQKRPARSDWMPDPALIQIIRTVWTKTSRGGVLASQRNAVPNALPFAASFSHNQPQDIWVQRVRFSETNGFTEPTSGDSSFVDEISILLEGVLVLRTGSSLSVSLDLDPAHFTGAPARTGRLYGRRPPSFSLLPGEWGRVSYNARHIEDEGWWYEKKSLRMWL
jgi:hypothetical protein